MSVATRNPFSILDAEDSSRPSTPPSKAAPEAPTASTRGTQRTRGFTSRGGKYYARGGRPGPRDTNQPQAEEPMTENQRKFEGRGRGRGGRGGARGGRRPFDKHSQTGKTDSDKKMHQAWGGDEGNTELKTEEAAANDAAAEAVPEFPADGAEPTTEAQPEARPRREREPEEEDTTLTLDEYFAQQKEKELTLPKIEGPRRANEGAEEDPWKGATPLSRNEDEESYYVGKTRSTPKSRTKKEEKLFIDIDMQFKRHDRGRGGRSRGDRARGFARGHSAPRGGSRQNGPSNLNVDDQTAFPSLA